MNLEQNQSLQEERRLILDDILLKFASGADYYPHKEFEYRQSKKGRIEAYDSLIKEGILVGRNDKVAFSPTLYFNSGHWKFDAVFIDRLLPRLKEMYGRNGAYRAAEFLNDETEALDLARALEILSWLGLIQNFNLNPIALSPAILNHSPTLSDRIRNKTFDISSNILRRKNSKEIVEKYLEENRINSLSPDYPHLSKHSFKVPTPTGQDAPPLEEKKLWDQIEKDCGITKKQFGKRIDFIKDKSVRSIIFRDIAHAQGCYSNEFYKPALILAGGVIEELLRRYLIYKGINPEKDEFYSYIKSCSDKKLLNSGTIKTMDGTRSFRNLVHLKEEASNRDVISKNKAAAAIHAIFTLSQDFQK